MMNTSRLRLATGALALTAFLAGCGDSTEPAGGGTTAASTTDGEQAAQEHNEADTMFAQMMIVHHEGAVEMAQVAQEQAVTPEVQELAAQIEAAQGPEIELMQSWLQQWGEPAASERRRSDRWARMAPRWSPLIRSAASRPNRCCLASPLPRTLIRWQWEPTRWCWLPSGTSSARWI